MSGDIRGSIVGVANASGVATMMQGYGQWGEPNADAAGRFGFTGQLRLHEVSPDLHKLGARIYSSRHGRFIEPDPIGTADDINLYSYVANDPSTSSIRRGCSQKARTASDGTAF